MNMLCSKCKERMAVLFIAHMEDGEMKNSGLCLHCAKEMNIPQVKEVMDKMGLSDEELEAMTNQMSEFIESEDIDLENFDISEMLGADTSPDSPFLKNMKNMFDSVGGGPEEKPENHEEDNIVDEAPVEEKKGRKKNPPKKKRKFLEGFCENLTEKAKNNEIDKIVGRDEEIYRVIQILNRRTKNNPVLIGEPGVGKTAIAEGIALRLASGDVPYRLADKELHLLDLTALVAGTQFRGQFESRVKGLLQDVKEAGNVILFIDEVHNIVGAGDSEGAMNTANILKPALSRGEIQVIGATTFNEYRKYIEKDSALERRFQPVQVNEPSIADAIEVLRGIKHYYEDFHRVKVPESIVYDSVVLSERYITDRYLPDKAIDLLDESCSRATLKNTDLAEYDKLNNDMKDILDKLEYYEEDVSGLTDADYQVLAELRADKMRIAEKMRKLEPDALGVSVSSDDLANVLELWTGIPASRIKETELKKVVELEKTLKSKVIGQDEAVELVAAAVRRSRVQISGRRKPASFIFVGPTGVGKTELVKTLSTELFDGTDPLIRLDMSEFMEKHAVSRIIGSPPGYVGYDEAGQLTEKVRRKPYSVILFDEIEKAHPDVMNILLQILDEGRITDAQGRKINFENTVIVMTSNAGSHMKGTSFGFNRTEQDMEVERAKKALEDFLRPEFLGRVDEIVVFRALNEENYASIAGLMLNELVEPLSERGITFTYTDDVTKIIAHKAFGASSGARDLRRVIRKEVEDIIANMILDNPDTMPSYILLNSKDDKLQISASGLINLPKPKMSNKE